MNFPIKCAPIVYCKFISILYLMLVVSWCANNIIQYRTSSFRCKYSLDLLRLLFIPEPDIKRFSIMSVDSSCGLTDVGVDGMDGVDGLLNLSASFFIIKSLLFSAAFLPSLSPAWEIQDCSAFLANGLTTVFPKEDATLLIGLRKLSTMMPFPLCLYTNLPSFG